MTDRAAAWDVGAADHIRILEELAERSGLPKRTRVSALLSSNEAARRGDHPKRSSQ
jgi:uncharacterized protein (UPF0147 family)